MNKKQISLQLQTLKNGGWKSILQVLDQSEMFSAASPTLHFVWTIMSAELNLEPCRCRVPPKAAILPCKPSVQ